MPLIALMLVAVVLAAAGLGLGARGAGPSAFRGLCVFPFLILAVCWLALVVVPRAQRRAKRPGLPCTRGALRPA